MFPADIKDILHILSDPAWQGAGIIFGSAIPDNLKVMIPMRQKKKKAG